MYMLQTLKAVPGFHQKKWKKSSHCNLTGFMGNVGISRPGIYEIHAGNRGWAVLLYKKLNTLTTVGWKLIVDLFIVLFSNAF